MRRRIKQLVLVGAAIGLLAWATLLLPADNRANAAEREGETSVTGSYTYVLDPEQALIHVTADLVLTHDIEEFRHSVFDGFVLWLPTNAVNTKASAYDGSGVLRPAEREYVHEFDHLEFIIRFRPLVAAGGSIHVVMTWDEPGFGPRSMQATRIDTAAGVFEVSGPGAPRGITYKVVAPPGFAYPDLPPGWVASTEDGSSVATLAATRDPDNYKVSLAVRDQEHMATSVVATDAGNFTVAGWNGDEPWSAFVQEQLIGAVAAVTDTLGEPWPATAPLTLVEAHHQSGTDPHGWHGPDDVFQLSEALDTNAMLHELAHAWYNDALFAERWMSEGFAQVTANAAAGVLGAGGVQAIEPDLDSDLAFPLAEWGDDDPGRPATIGRELYAQNASTYLVQSLIDEIGPEKMGAVLQAARATVGTATEGGVPTVVDWRRMLSLLEDVGGSTEARALFDRLVVPSGDDGVLDERTALEEQASALAEDEAGWAVPVAVREAMARWDLPSAESAIDNAHEVLDLQHEIDALEATAASPPAPSLQEQYEATETDFRPLRDALQARADALRAIIAAAEEVNAADGPVSGFGLLGTDLEGRLDDARTHYTSGAFPEALSVAKAVEKEARGARSAAADRLVALLAVLAVGTTTTLVFLRRRRARRAEGAA